MCDDVADDSAADSTGAMISLKLRLLSSMPREMLFNNESLTSTRNVGPS